MNIFNLKLIFPICSKGEDAARYLKSGGGKAAYMVDANGKGTLILGTNPTRQEIVEELIHHEQNIRYGSEYMVEKSDLIELEAQDRLLKIGEKEGWSKVEIDEIKKLKNIGATDFLMIKREKNYMKEIIEVLISVIFVF